jgi:hypothetical protein
VAQWVKIEECSGGWLEGFYIKVKRAKTLGRGLTGLVGVYVFSRLSSFIFYNKESGKYGKVGTSNEWMDKKGAFIQNR